MLSNFIDSIVVDQDGSTARINTIWVDGASLHACVTYATGGFGTFDVTQLRCATDDEASAFCEDENSFGSN